jgi:dolichyl-phosphate beta-glucosyltransferase
MQKTGLVVPCYNEATRLDAEAYVAFANANENVEFLFVDDGSSDDTWAVLSKLCDRAKGRASAHKMENNSGKAEAVRTGMLRLFDSGKYDYVGFWDADLATPLAEVNYMLNFKKNENKSVIIASRIKRLGASVTRKGSRHFFGRVFSTFASIILKLPVYDTQCGAKLFHNSTKDLFADKFVTSWLFDVEILARFRNKKGIEATLKEIVEVPVNSWKDVGGSKLKLKHLIKVPFELLKIRNTYNA